MHLVILPRLDLKTKGRSEHQHTRMQAGYYEALWTGVQRSRFIDDLFREARSSDDDLELPPGLLCGVIRISSAKEKGVNKS